MVELVGHGLQELAAFRIEGLDRRAQVDVLARLDGNAHDIELGHQVLEVIDVEDAADRSRYARRLGEDEVAAGCQVVAPPVATSIRQATTGNLVRRRKSADRAT